MDLDLSTDAPPSPERTLKLAETLAELVRVLNHTTMHHEALRYPAEAYRVIQELSSAAQRLPQLFAQISRWLSAEQAAGRVTATGGEYGGRPDMAVVAAMMRLDEAQMAAGHLQEALAGAASQASCMGAAEHEDGTDGD